MIHCPTVLLSVAYLILSATPLARAEQDQSPPPAVPTSVTAPAAPAPPAPAPMPPSPAPEGTPRIPAIPGIPPVPRIAPVAPPLPPPVSPGSPDEIDAPMDNALSNGILEEEGNQNPEAAIAAYQSAITRFDRQRPTIANAIFRLGECYRKLGRIEEAKTQYARILREFPDQVQLVQLSQKHLFQKQAVRDRLQNIVARAPKPEVAEPVTGGGGTPANSVNQQKELIEQEIALVETQLAIAKKKTEMGAGPQEDIIPLQREILRLKRQLVSLAKPDLLSVAPSKQPDENPSPTIAGNEPESGVIPAESTMENIPPQPRSRGNEKTQLRDQADRLKQIGLAVRLRMDTGNAPLTNLNQLRDKELKPEALLDPVSGSPFVFRGAGNDTRPQETIAFGAPTKSGTRNVLLGDGSVQQVDAKKFNELLDFNRTLARYKRYMTGSPNIGGQGGGGFGGGGGGGTRESATPNPWLLNVAFGSSLNKRGPAATGNGPEDYWNGYYLPWVQVVPLVNLMLADRAMTSAGLTVSNAAGTWGNATGDAMYDAYVYPNGDNLDKITVTITNLPPGQYDFYLYGHADPATQVEGNSFFSAVVGNRRWGPVGTKSSVGWTADQPWVEGQQYVVLRNVQVVNQSPVILYVAPGRNGQLADGAERPPVINGLQIRRASSSSRPRPPIQTF